MSRVTRRLSLALACTIALAPLLAAAADAKKTAHFKGKVVPLAALVAKDGGKLDADAAPHWLALVGDDGKVYPLVKDSGSRLFFKDPALLNRPMRLTGKLVPGSQLLRVTAVHSVRKGQLHEVYYWCDICAIRRSEKNLCECCGAPMELREEPVKK
jgi:hypothetical protein